MNNTLVKVILLAALALTAACSTTGVKTLDDGRKVYTGNTSSDLKEESIIEGYVYNQKTRKAVSNARVEVKNANMGIGYYLVKTNSRGKYQIKNFIPHVRYVMEVTSPGYVSYKSTGTISPGERDVYLDPEAILSGRVSDSSGKPIKGIEVKLSRGSRYSYYGGSRRPLFTVTDAKGNYRFDKLVQGRYSATFSGKGYIPETARLKRLRQGEPFDLQMKLFKPAVITGKVKISGLDIPARNINVRARGRVSHSVKTYQDGTYRLEELKPGYYDLKLSHQGFFSIERKKVYVAEGRVISGTDFTVKAKKPEINVYSYRYTFVPGNALSFNLRTFRPEKVTAAVYKVPLKVFVQGKSDPDTIDPAASKFKKVTSWDEPIKNFQPYQWRYQNLVIKTPLSTGGYCLEVKGAGRVISRRYFTVTSVGAVVKRSRGQVFAYVTDLVTNKPVSGASIVVFDATAYKGTGRHRKKIYKKPNKIEDLPVRVVHRGKTDARGIYSYRHKTSAHLSLLAIGGDGSYAICNTGSPTRFQREKYKYFIYTDRPVYRSGDKVSYKILAKERKKHFVPMAGKRIYYKIKNSDSGRTIKSGSVALDQWGTTHGSIKIPETAGLGTFIIRAGPTKSNLYGSGRFYVEQYRKPEYVVEVTPEKDYFINGDDVSFRVQAKYFFGAPLKGGLVRYRFYESRLRDTDTNYWWEEGRSSSSYNRVRLDGEKYLDKNGIISLKLFAGNYPYDREITLEVTVIDESNVSITARKKVRIGRGEYYIKINPKQNFFAGSDKKKVTIKTLTHTGKPIKAPVKIQMYRYIWKPYQRVYIHEGRPRYEKRITTNKKGEAVIELPAKFADYGEYDIVASSFDRRRNRITASRVIWVYNPQGGRVASRFRNLELSVNKDTLKSEGTITALLKSRFSGGYVCLTLEGRDIYYSKVVKMKGNVMPVTLPVKAGYAPNFYISAIMQRKRALFRSMKNINIPVKGTTLKVSLKPEKPVYLPGDKAKIHLVTTDGDGKPVAADLSLAAVDEAIYSIRRDHTPAMKNFFYTKISNWVLTSYSYPISILAGAGKEGKIKVREKFEDTAYWKSNVRTNRRGRATVSFTLPDNLTTWRLTARGHDLTGRVGESKKKFLVTQDLIARIGKPRFFIEGDRLSLLGIVNSNTNRGLPKVSSTFRVDGKEVKASKQRAISLPPFGSARNLYLVTVPGKKEKLVLRFDTKADGSGRDALRVKVPVEKRGAAFKLFGLGDMGMNKVINLEPVKGGSDFEFLPEKVDISVSPGPLFKMIAASEYLVKYPYGCVEQTINSFMPVMILHRFLKKKDALHLVKAKDVAKIKEKTVKGLRRLERLQRSDGSWGWFSGDRGNAFLTGYVMISLSSAMNEGYTVSERVVKRGLGAVKRMLTSSNISNMDSKAYLLYVYSLFGKWNYDAFNSLLAVKKPNPYQLSFLVRALEQREMMRVIDSPDSVKNEEYRKKQLALAVAALKEKVLKDVKGIYWTSHGAQRWSWPGGRAEMTAHALAALVAVKDPGSLPSQAAASLVKRSRNSRWTSTKETATVMVALTDYLKQRGLSTEREIDLAFKINEKEVATIAYRPANKEPAAVLSKRVKLTGLAPGKAIRVEAAGKAAPDVSYDISVSGTLYFKPSGFTSIFKSEDRSLATLSNGISLFRSYASLHRVKDLKHREYLVPGKMSAKKRIEVGDEMLVKIRFRASDNFEYLLLEDFLPSGFEVVKKYAYDIHKPFVRSERWDNRMVYFFTNLKKGRVYEVAYIIRAELPGKFMVRPARMECMYEPSIQGWSAPMIIEVKNKELMK